MQRSWPAQVVLNLAYRLIYAGCLADNIKESTRFCEDIVYNARRTHGVCASDALESYGLLTRLYTSMAHLCKAKTSSEKADAFGAGYFKKALLIHEEVLYQLADEFGAEHDADDERVPTAGLRHFRLLKLAYQRLGGWPKPYKVYEQLNGRLFRVFGIYKEWRRVQGMETWSAKDFGRGKAEAEDGAFEGVDNWGFANE